jgi:hypothetical protein
MSELLDLLTHSCVRSLPQPGRTIITPTRHCDENVVLRPVIVAQNLA